MSTLTITTIQTTLAWEDKPANLQRLEEKIGSIKEENGAGDPAGNVQHRLQHASGRTRREDGWPDPGLDGADRRREKDHPDRQHYY